MEKELDSIPIGIAFSVLFKTASSCGCPLFTPKDISSGLERGML